MSGRDAPLEPRYRMPRKFFRRLSAPYRGNQDHAAWYIRPFRALLAHPVYFSINRRTITGGLALGLFIGVLPFVGHMPVAIALGLLLRVNVPVAILGTWLGNPLTYGPIFYLEYRVGAWLLGLPRAAMGLDQSWEQWLGQLASVWKPLWLGAIVTGLALAAIGYLLGNAAWRITTRLRLQRRVERRFRTPP
ncbi:MAG: DUF2062 domain-containing protein [Chromatiales bacterium]|nr:DUF2062 domain-containing protein [Chromatiales bacterium]